MRDLSLDMFVYNLVRARNEKSIVFGDNRNYRLHCRTEVERALMAIITGLFRALVGAVFGLCAGVALSPLLASFSEGSGAIGLPILILVGILLGAFAPTIRRAFGRGFLLVGASVFLLPLSALVLSGVAMSETVSAANEVDKGFAVIGSGIAGGLFTGLASLVGFFFGGILLLVGAVLSLGGRREVVLVDRK